MARVDVRATAAAGVWRSPQPLPLAHLAVTVNASDSGDVLIFWTQPVNVAPPPPGIAADGSLSIGQAAIFDTGRTGRGTVYLCDSHGGAIDVLVAGSELPIGATPSPPNVRPLRLAQPLLTHLVDGSIWAETLPLPIPPGTVSVLIAIDVGTPGIVLVQGAQTGIAYYSGPPIPNLSLGGSGGTIVCQVSSVNDSELIVGNHATDGLISGYLIPLQEPYVPQPLTVTVPNPLPVTVGYQGIWTIAAEAVLNPAATATILGTPGNMSQWVFGYSLTIGPASTNLGGYQLVVEDETGAVVVAHLAANQQTPVGQSNIVAQHVFPGAGITLPIGKALRVRAPAANVGAALIRGVFDVAYR